MLHFRPDLIDYSSLTPMNPSSNLDLAFSLADNLGLDSLINPEDLEEDSPDEKSIMTYLVTYYHYFSKLKKGSVFVNRIAKVFYDKFLLIYSGTLFLSGSYFSSFSFIYLTNLSKTS